MTILQELFNPLNPMTSSIRSHKAGHVFHLGTDLGLVMEGIVATDTLAPCAKANPLTVRLAGTGDILNLESYANRNPNLCQYTCETPVVICLTNIETIRAQAARLPPVQQVAVVNEIIKLLQGQLTQVTESAMWIGSAPSVDRLEWAVGRLNDLARGEPLRLSPVRSASHIGSELATVHRATRQLQEAGRLVKINKNTYQTGKRV